MSKVIIGSVGGGGAGSDECTARLSDIPAGLKAVTADSGDEAGVGTMALTGNAQAGHVLAGETFYTNDYKTRQTGTLQTMAGKTITPGAAQQSAGCVGKYMSGDIIVPGFAMPAADQIKKGTAINIYGRTVVGTFEGWVPTPTDLYLRGNNIAGFTGNVFESGGIRLPPPRRPDNLGDYSSLGIMSAGNIDYAPYNYLNIEGYFENRYHSMYGDRNVTLDFEILAYGGDIIASAKTPEPAQNSNFTRSIDIRNVSLSRRSLIKLSYSGEYHYIGNEGDHWNKFSSYGWVGYVYRIWLS